MNEKNDGVLIRASGLWKSYRLGKTEVPVLLGVDFEVRRGEWIALLGKSGSGKTTLLNVIGALERPDKGAVSYNDREYSSFSKRQAAAFRCSTIGFIFQFYHMFPELTILDNVTLPARLNKGSVFEASSLAERLLVEVGLGHRIRHRPNELSGGEQQRAAIARALVNSPEFILADEPTGNLDSKTGEGILEIFKNFHGGDFAKTIIMVTHDEKVASLADRVLRIVDGKIEA